MWKGNYAIKTLPLCITSRSSVVHLRQINFDSGLYGDPLKNKKFENQFCA